MHKKSLSSLAGKLIPAIGSMMFIMGLLFAYAFNKQHPEVGLFELFLYGGSFVVLISFFLCLILYFIVTKPLSYLVDAMNRLSKGDMEYRVDIKTKDEIGILSHSFNSMVDELQQYKEKMENWTRSLEEEVQKKTSEIYKAQEQLINTEKLASLGRMAAGVAHEINSPLTGIVTFAHLMLKRVPPGNAEDIEDLNVIISQAERCSTIIKGLLGFSRRTASEKTRVNLNTLVENTLNLVKNQSKFHNIAFDIQLVPALPEVVIDPNQVQQVFLNLLINAADAMEERGKITISSGMAEEEGIRFARLAFADTGPGISRENLGKIFEPFFTTKPAGKGTGLGLAVSYGIIEKHGGQIQVESEEGKGTTFFIKLPLA
ncbi:MAG: HAMP domain-containing protein [Alphaproteobacteria bacterium]|uniref:histidine kinase n=1 Tax=Candidatus Nitrobium versatile TaxID=2884831 RepID=A0A953J7Z9_9BACT|nr:HAMP domain-containing protein [Candidatus Nitrobium versatile]